MGGGRMKIRKLDEKEYLRKIVKEDLFTDTDAYDWGERDSDEYAEAVKNILMSFYIPDDDELSERFRRSDRLKKHFTDHCFGFERKSTSTNVYYDFTELEDYKKRVSFVDSLSSDMTISDLHYHQQIDESLFLLSRGNGTIFFTDACGLVDENNNPVSLKIHSFCTDVTKNYKNQNTADYVFYKGNGITTKTQYPISFTKLVSRFEELKL